MQMARGLLLFFSAMGSHPKASTRGRLGLEAFHKLAALPGLKSFAHNAS